MSDAPHPLLARRTSGVLLHLTSLPGPHGSGDLGREAHHFLDWLVSAGQSLWQILPLTTPGPGHSPYQSLSAFAGSPWLVDLEDLVQRGWLAALPDPGFGPGPADFDRVIPWRLAALQQAWAGFQARATPADRAALATFRDTQADWLQDYTRFMVLHERHGAHWTAWPDALARHEPAALAALDRASGPAQGFWAFVQWCFERQWQQLREAAHRRGLAIAGDVPIFVAHHSADVWAQPALFELDARGEPTVVAGVPPDYFSATGQRWGNPLYDWDAMARDGWRWWTRRLARLLAQVDVVRVDHFRGFESCWAIPASEPTAVGGEWRPGPGRALFDALRAALGPLPLIAEDLGLITEAVRALREDCGFPGMRVAHFAFGDTPDNPYLPHNHAPAAMACPGTHDNNTTVGWWLALDEGTRQAVRAYLGPEADTAIHWALIRALSQSVARTLIVPFQDVLGLDGAHRLNVPGQAEGCWTWRFDWSQVDAAPAARLAALTAAHGRGPRPRAA